MEGFFYARIVSFELQVYSESPEALADQGVIYLELSDDAYSRAELWFLDRYERDVPGNEVAVSGTGGATSFRAYFRLEKMPLIVDMLRDNDNVWFTWDAARVAAIRTGREPTTETGEAAE